MQPTDSFWTGAGEAVGNSPGWMVVGTVLVIGVLLIVAKYIVPSLEKTRMRRLDIEQQRVQNDADRIKANAMLSESMRQTNTLIDGMRQSLDSARASSDLLASEVHGSRDSSRRMGETVAHAAEQVDDIHRVIVRQKGGYCEGTD